MGCELCKPLCPLKSTESTVCSCGEKHGPTGLLKGGGFLSNIHLLLWLKQGFVEMMDYRSMPWSSSPLAHVHSGMFHHSLSIPFSWMLQFPSKKKTKLITVLHILLDCYLQHFTNIEACLLMLIDGDNGHLKCLNNC